jgi:hypothetical protein
MCYILQLTLLSTFSKDKVKNNLSNGCLINVVYLVSGKVSVRAENVTSR